MSTEVQTRRPNEVAVVREQLSAMESQFEAALPAHIPVERFNRVVLTAIQNNPDLLRCDRKSLFNSAMKAAQDGLLPDGREGAIVPYKNEATWMPMIGGIRKKVRNSGDIASWDVHSFYLNDMFEFELGDDPYIKHRPALTNKGKLIAVYSVAVLKGGEKSRDVMSVEDVEKIRALSRGKNTPWNNPTFYAEMAKKTVARRHSKVLPMSSDLDDLIRRDDALYDLQAAGDAEVKGPRPTLSAALDRLAAPTIEVVTTDTGGSGGATADETDSDVGDSDDGIETSAGPTSEPERQAEPADRAAEGKGSGVQSSAASDFPGDQPASSSKPDFEALLAEFERDAPNATTEEELGDLAADLRKAMDEHTPSQAFQKRASAVWKGHIDRIKGVSQQPKGTSVTPTDDPDFQKGWADAKRGASKCLKQDIRDNPDRMAKWQAGYDAFKAQGAEG